MKFSPDAVASQLAERFATACCVAFSGGLDSTVLLHALSSIRTEHDISLRAIHVDHGLHPDSASWSSHCIHVASALGVDCAVLRVSVCNDGQGMEAAAREARYAALAEALGENEWLLTAQHADDQAETVLLALLRGSGPAGLAAMPISASFGRGRLLRPLLGVTRVALEEWAEAQGLMWLDDPSNQNRSIARNHLRHEVMPVLKARWPAAEHSFSRSAGLAAEADELLTVLGLLDLEALSDGPMLDAEGVAALGPVRARNLLRVWLTSRGLPHPPYDRLIEAQRQLHAARNDRAPTVRWAGAVLRRWQGRLYAGTEAERAPLGWSALWDGATPLLLPSGLGSIALEPAGHGLDVTRLQGKALEVRFRSGGERLRLHANGPHRVVKHLLAEAGIPPWERDQVPLLYCEGTLIAVGNLYLDADWVAPEGRPAYALVWFPVS